MLIKILRFISIRPPLLTNYILLTKFSGLIKQALRFKRKVLN